MSDLQLLIEYDMYVNGYDPTDPDDIKAYWEERLG